MTIVDEVDSHFSQAMSPSFASRLRCLLEHSLPMMVMP
jgi:hypothetical protein